MRRVGRGVGRSSLKPPEEGATGKSVLLRVVAALQHGGDHLWLRVHGIVPRGLLATRSCIHLPGQMPGAVLNLKGSPGARRGDDGVNLVGAIGIRAGRLRRDA